MVLKMQELLLSRGLKPRDVMLIFLEFDTSADGALNLATHTASHTATPSPSCTLSHPSHTPLTPARPCAPLTHPSRPLAGALDLAEFRAALDVMGVKLPGDKLRHVFEFFDADGDMQLDACEFCQARFRPCDVVHGNARVVHDVVHDIVQRQCAATCMAQCTV